MLIRQLVVIIHSATRGSSTVRWSIQNKHNEVSLMLLKDKRVNIPDAVLCMRRQGLDKIAEEILLLNDNISNQDPK